MTLPSKVECNYTPWPSQICLSIGTYGFIYVDNVCEDGIDCYPTEIGILLKDTNENVYANFICNSTKLQTTQSNCDIDI